MQRRKFINLAALMGLSTIASSSLYATDYRHTKAAAWTANTVDDAIQKMYGDISTIHNGITLGVPKVASNGANVPLDIRSDIPAKSLTIFQNVNPEATVIAYSIHKNSLIDYSLKIKMQEGPGEITVILEGRDGKFYATRKTLIVAGGGCDP